MEDLNLRYIDVTDPDGIECIFCGCHNEIPSKLLDMATYWLGVDTINPSCIECGKPFYILRNAVTHTKMDINGLIIE